MDETKGIITIEDHNITGGLGTAVAEVIAEYGKKTSFCRVGLNGFSHGYGSYEEVKKTNGVGREHIKEEVLKMLN